ncbi:hypothetical protein AAW14_20330 [Streptomyces hygroscopicus]|nr:hypothetical protein [Streptomyces hygroscopicus]
MIAQQVGDVSLERTRFQRVRVLGTGVFRELLTERAGGDERLAEMSRLQQLVDVKDCTRQIIGNGNRRHCTVWQEPNGRDGLSRACWWSSSGVRLARSNGGRFFLVWALDLADVRTEG